MNKLRNLMRGLASTALLALFSFTWTTDGMAANQQVAGEMEEVVVVAAPIMRSWTEPGRYGGKTEVIELTRRVNFADLDLSSQADVTTLETRIEAVAKESCESLSDMFPLDPSDKMEIHLCTKKAVKGTKEQVKAAIAAAQ